MIPKWFRSSYLCFLAFCLSSSAAPLSQPAALDGPDKPLFFSLALRRGGGTLGLTLDGARHLTKPVFVGVNAQGRALVRVGDESREAKEKLPDTVRLVGRIRVADGTAHVDVLATALGEAGPEPGDDGWALRVTGPLQGESLAEYFLDFVNGASGQFLDVRFGDSWEAVAQPLVGGLVPGRFGSALDVRESVGQTEPRAEFAQRVFTVEAWVKVKLSGSYNILLAHAPKSSDAHWELYTERRNGALAVYMPANKPAVMTSPQVIADDQWHHVAMVTGMQTVRLFVDGKEVLKAPHTRTAAKDTREWGLVVGALQERNLRCDGVIDEVRLSHGARSITNVPEAPLTADESTFGLWRFDDVEGGSSPNAVASGPPVRLETSRPNLDYPTVRHRIEPTTEVFTEAEVLQILPRFGIKAGGFETRPGVLRHWGQQYRELQDQIAGRRGLPHGAKEQALDAQALIQEGDTDPTSVVLRRTRALLNLLMKQYPDRDFSGFDAILERLASSKAGRGDLYLAACDVRRQLMLYHPLLDFDRLLFIKRGTYAGSRLVKMRNRDPEGGHFANQYFGFNSIPDGGIYVLENLKGNATVRDLLADNPALARGSVQGPDLSFDGQEIAFAHCAAQGHDWHDWTRDTTWNLFRMQADGSGLRQLTDSACNDFDPCWLPDGRLAFVSERRGGFIRCFGSYVRVPNYVLHSMRADGTDIIPLSYYETSEWNPSVDNQGMLVYGRWDYTDRENCLGSNFWTCYPDGRNPRAPHGNYPYPWHTFAENPTNLSYHIKADTRRGRPYAEMGIRAIPGSRRYVLVGAPHHGEAFGSLCMLDVSVPDDGSMSQLRRITPYVPFPETESPARSQYQYGTPWPLSEDLYLCNSWEDIVLLDRFGNEEVICERELVPGAQDDRFRLTDPIPLRPRTHPPGIPSGTGMGADRRPDQPRARISVMNVYDTDIPLPPGTKIKYLRILQNFLKTNHAMGQPLCGYQNEAVPRMPLGLVPVEEDGSVYLQAPPGKELLFQLVDEDFMAVQTMRSVAFVHPGESLSCAGCHEPTQSSPRRAKRLPQAMAREPSRPVPELARLEPISYYRHIQPLTETTCLPCHRQHPKAPAKLGYEDLRPYVFYFAGGMSRTTVKPVHGGSRSIPGHVGARASRLGQAMLAHRANKRIPEEAYRTVVLWLDANAPRLTALHREQDQKAGQLVWPKLDVDPRDPLGLEGDPGENTPARIAHAAALQHPGGPEGVLGERRRFITTDHRANKVFIVGENGHVEWEYACDHPQDVWLLPNGNVLVAWYRAAQEIRPDFATGKGGEVVWEHRVEAPNEIPTCQPLGSGLTLVGVCGPCELREVDRAGKVVRRVPLQSKAKLHSQFRFCRKTPKGTYLVPFIEERKVQEVDASGRVLHELSWPYPVVSATRLTSGNTLIGGGKLIREYDAQWRVVWEMDQDDLGYQLILSLIAGTRRLPNGNTLVTNYGANGTTREDAQIFEITPGYRIVWRFGGNPALGTLAQSQFLGAGDEAKR
jgi:hypothetical protein